MDKGGKRTKVAELLPLKVYPYTLNTFLVAHLTCLCQTITRCKGYGYTVKGDNCNISSPSSQVTSFKEKNLLL